MNLSGPVRNWLRRRICPDLMLALVLLTLTIGLTGAPAFADDLFDSGKLLATAGGSEVEGAGGGGLASWALITGYGTRDGIGANAHYSAVVLPDYSMQTAGPAVRFFA